MGLHSLLFFSHLMITILLLIVKMHLSVCTHQRFTVTCDFITHIDMWVWCLLCPWLLESEEKSTINISECLNIIKFFPSFKPDLEINNVGLSKTFICLQTWVLQINPSSLKHHECWKLMSDYHGFDCYR